jgi:2-oxoisovalerate dehydrogenase E1 component
MSHATTVRTEPSGLQSEGLSTELRLRILRLMLTARACDEAEITLKRRGQGHFQLPSSGHEAVAAIPLALREEDWIMPHYRDRGLFLARGLVPEDFFRDFLARRDSMTSGRQMPYHVTDRARRIASISSPVGTNFLHAVGLAESLRARKQDEIVVALTGDASTREGEILEGLLQAVAEQLPILFVVEDNGYGISTRTEGKTFWSVPHGMAERENGRGYSLGCPVEIIDGLDPEAIYAAAASAVEKVRSGSGPYCIVAQLERMGSHSSSDDQRQYRTPEELDRLLQRDPVKTYAERLQREGVISASDLEKLRQDVAREIEEALQRAQAATEPDPAQDRDGLFAPLPVDLPRQESHRPAFKATSEGGLTLGQCMNRVLAQELARNPRVHLTGEDVEDPKGDVFGVTRGLSTQFPGKVVNSPLAEATIMGASIGRAMAGDTAVAAIQFVDFIGPALNQLFNEAATMYWRSKGEWNCPLVVFSPCGAYLPGLGPWHAQTGESIFAHIPGLHVVMPSTPADAAGLLRFALRCNRPVVFLYPKALLFSLEETCEEPAPDYVVPFGLARTARAGRDVTVVTWGNGVPLALKAAKTLAARGTELEVLDLRSISPWDMPAVQASVKRTGRLLVIHEDNRTCGLGGEIVAEICEREMSSLRAAPRRLTRADRHLPYHFAMEQDILPQENDVLNAVQQMLAERSVAPSPATARAPAAPGAASAVPAPSAPHPGAAPHSTVATASRRLAVVVPKQSPTDEEATVIRFHVKEGQAVQTGTILIEMEANKGSFEIESPHPGRVIELRAKEGERVRIGSTVLYLEVSESVGLEKLDRPGEPGVPSIKEIRLSPAQLQVGALAVKSLHEIPAVSVECEVDVTQVVRDREALRSEFVKQWGVQVSYTHIILWAMAQALKEERNEGFRGRLDEKAERLLISPNVTLGLAIVGRNEDLYSPVLRRADQMSLHDIVRRVKELTKAVREGQVNVADLYGATITLTNIGPLQGQRGTPFVLPGQVAMVAVGSLVTMPRYVENGDGRTLEPRDIIYLKLVFDHRPFNGTHAMSLLRSIRDHLESMALREHLSVKT